MQNIYQHIFINNFKKNCGFSDFTGKKNGHICAFCWVMANFPPTSIYLYKLTLVFLCPQRPSIANISGSPPRAFIFVFAYFRPFGHIFRPLNILLRPSGLCSLNRPRSVRHTTLWALFCCLFWLECTTASCLRLCQSFWLWSLNPTNAWGDPIAYIDGGKFLCNFEWEANA